MKTKVQCRNVKAAVFTASLVTLLVVSFFTRSAAAQGQSKKPRQQAQNVLGQQEITVTLPTDTFDNQVDITTIIIEPVVTTFIDPGLGYVGFQGDFTYDSAVVGFATPQVQAAGLTGANWNVSSNILNTGPGTLKTLRISAFSLDFTPLNGMGTLFNLRMLRVSNNPGDMSPLVWAAPPNQFIFIDDNLGSHTPNQTNGLITITGVATTTPSPTATSTATATAPAP